MKKPAVLSLLCALALALTACTANNLPEEQATAPSDIVRSESSEMSSAIIKNKSYKESSAIAENESSDYAAIPYDPQTLAGMSYKEFMDKYGEKRASLQSYEGGYNLIQSNKVYVHFRGEDKDGNMISDDVNDWRVMGFFIYNDSVELYRGIKVGKTVEEINSNLSNKFEIVPDEMEGGLTAVGWYKYKLNKIEVRLTLNDAHVVTRLTLNFNKTGKELRRNREII